APGVREARRRQRPDEVRADARCHRQRRRVPRLRGSALHHRPGADGRWWMRDVVVRGEPRSGGEPSAEMIEVVVRGEPRSGGEASSEMIEVVVRGEPRSGGEVSGEMIRKIVRAEAR